MKHRHLIKERLFVRVVEKKKAARKDLFPQLFAIDLLAVFRMPKRKPTPTGPMRMQPIEHGSILPTQGLPMMPTAGKAAKPPQPKRQRTRAEAVRAAKARIVRRDSLRTQRQAQKGKLLP